MGLSTAVLAALVGLLEVTSLAQTAALPGAARVPVHVVTFTFAADPQDYFPTKEARRFIEDRLSDTRQLFREQSAGRLEVVFEWHPQVVVNQPMVAGDTKTAAQWGYEAIVKAGLNGTRDRVMVMERQVNYGQFAIGPIAFFMGSPGSIFHELAHTFGVRHSGTLVCQQDGRTVTWAGDLTRCATDEYGDRYSPMSSAGAALPGAVLNSYQRLNAGFLPAMALQVLPYGTDATVTLARLGARTGVQMVRVPLREQSGLPPERHEFFDLEYNPVANAVLMYYGRCERCNEAPTRLLDLTPGDQNFLNGSFQVGKPYLDPAAKIQLTLVSQNQNQASLRVQFNAATR